MEDQSVGIDGMEVKYSTAPLETEAQEKPGKWSDVDDKDIAMAGIVILCVVGGIVLAVVNGSGAAIGAIFTGGITALGSLASGRKK